MTSREKPDRAIYLTLAVEAHGIEHPEPWQLPWLRTMPLLTARARFQCQMPCGHVVWGSYDVQYSVDEVKRHYHHMFRKLWDTFVMSRLSLEAEPCPECGATTAPPPEHSPPDPDDGAPFLAAPRIIWRH